MKPIFIIGYMGVGKTTVGRGLAEFLGCRHVDTDELVSECCNMSVSDIFAAKGEKFFRLKEYEVLLPLLTAEDTVVSLGGGTPCFFDSMEKICTCGTVLFLNMKPENIVCRLLSETEKRPLIADKTEVELVGFVTVSLRERMRYYGMAHHTLDVDNKTVEQIIKEIEDNEYIRK